VTSLPLTSANIEINIQELRYGQGTNIVRINGISTGSLTFPEKTCLGFYPRSPFRVSTPFWVSKIE